MLPQIKIPPRPSNFKIVYHLYIVFAQNRDNLLQHCLDNGIEAKVHYPTPIYRQPGFEHWAIKGDFPVTDEHTRRSLRSRATTPISGRTNTS